MCMISVYYDDYGDDDSSTATAWLLQGEMQAPDGPGALKSSVCSLVQVSGCTVKGKSF